METNENMRERLVPIIQMLDSAFPGQDFAMALVILDVRAEEEGGTSKLMVCGNRLGHGKYDLMAYAIEHEYEEAETSDITPELKN